VKLVKIKMRFNKKNVIREIDECIGAFKVLRSSDRNITILEHLRATVILMNTQEKSGGKE